MVNTNDLSLVIGVALVALSIPSLFSAFVEERPPRLGAIICLSGLALVALAVNAQGYGLDDIPAAVSRVLRGLLG
jgi:hypothetical protein